jgi:hypothetical protein
MIIRWELPIKTVSEANCNEYFRIKHARHKEQQFFVRELFKTETQIILLPCRVKMTRLSPRMLDEDDNLRMAFKWIKDEISECLIPEKAGFCITKKGKFRKIKGRADSDARISWEYAQEKSKIGGVRIEISF